MCSEAGVGIWSYTVVMALKGSLYVLCNTTTWRASVLVRPHWNFTASSARIEPCVPFLGRSCLQKAHTHWRSYGSGKLCMWSKIETRGREIVEEGLPSSDLSRSITDAKRIYRKWAHPHWTRHAFSWSTWVGARPHSLSWYVPLGAWSSACSIGDGALVDIGNDFGGKGGGGRVSCEDERATRIQKGGRRDREWKIWHVGHGLVCLCCVLSFSIVRVDDGDTVRVVHVRGMREWNISNGKWGIG